MHTERRSDGSMLLSGRALGDQSPRGEEREEKGEKFI
jgi:hypothetical protein